MIGTVLQFFLLPILIQNTFYSLIIGNSLYFIGFSYYCFITSRGLAELNYLKNLEVFLYPIILVGFFWLISILFKYSFVNFMLNSYV